MNPPFKTGPLSFAHGFHEDPCLSSSFLSRHVLPYCPNSQTPVQPSSKERTTRNRCKSEDNQKEQEHETGLNLSTFPDWALAFNICSHEAKRVCSRWLQALRRHHPHQHFGNVFDLLCKLLLSSCAFISSALTSGRTSFSQYPERPIKKRALWPPSGLVLRAARLLSVGTCVMEMSFPFSWQILPTISPRSYNAVQFSCRALEESVTRNVSPPPSAKQIRLPL